MFRDLLGQFSQMMYDTRTARRGPNQTRLIMAQLNKNQQERRGMGIMSDGERGVGMEADAARMAQNAYSALDGVNEGIEQADQREERRNRARNTAFNAIGAGLTSVLNFVAPAAMPQAVPTDAELDAVDEHLMNTPGLGVPFEEEPEAATEELPGLMAPLSTAEQRRRMHEAPTEIDPITRAQGAASFYNQDGSFNNVEFHKQLDALVEDPLTSAMLKGLIQTETSNTGPITESMWYTMDGANRVWKPISLNRQVAASLPAAERRRLEEGRSSEAFGEAMMDIKYRGGSDYRGRGFMQLTHNNQYQAVQDILAEQGVDIDIVGNPDLVTDPDKAFTVLAAYLQYKGMDAERAKGMSSRGLNRFINPGAPASVANARWDAVISYLRDAGETELADEYEKRDEYAAQQIIGTPVDGVFGPNSMRAARTWANARNVTIPADATAMEVVELINTVHNN